MSNYEYDALYDELAGPGEGDGGGAGGEAQPRVSATRCWGSCPRRPTRAPCCPLNKTKSVDELREWLGDQRGLLSWKMDGLTVVLTYEGGTLVKAVTRGNGEIGEVITNNAECSPTFP